MFPNVSTTLVIVMLLAVQGFGPCLSSALAQKAVEATGENVDIQADDHAKLASAQQQINDGSAILLDVRELSERQVAHFAKSIHIPSSLLQDAAKRANAVADLPKDKPIYCHCRGGGRAQKCAKLLREMGYEVRALAIPFDKLKEAGFETAR